MNAPGREHEAEQEGRRLALGAIFEADFGQTTGARALQRRLDEEGTDSAAASHAGAIVDAVVVNRNTIDALITRTAPQYPVTQLARIDRALLRCALGELLHCPTTPTRVAIAEWVEIARTYSGEPARRLLNGVLGRVASEASNRSHELSASDNGNEGGGGDRHTGGALSDRFDV